VQDALPTRDHFIPLLIADGTAYDCGGSIITGVEGFVEARASSRRSLPFN
jgi:hypothetical protein